MVLALISENNFVCLSKPERTRKEKKIDLGEPMINHPSRPALPVPGRTGKADFFQVAKREGLAGSSQPVGV